MKAVLVSLLVLISTAAKANQEIRFDPNNTPPISAKLAINGISRNMTTINPKFALVVTANVTFNNKTLDLTLTKRMPQCGAGMMCIQVMPAPLRIKLNVTKVEQLPCSTKYFASTPSDVRTLVYEQVVVEDFSSKQCPQTMDKPYTFGTVSYKATGISSLTKVKESAEAHFTVVGDFVRAVN
ncbi:hypothetical protein K2P97_08210 [bacterium]|nr:hypothetical protein [bacterium]